MNTQPVDINNPCEHFHLRCFIPWDGQVRCLKCNPWSEAEALYDGAFRVHHISMTAEGLRANRTADNLPDSTLDMLICDAVEDVPRTKNVAKATICGTIPIEQAERAIVRWGERGIGLWFDTWRREIEIRW